MADLCIPRAIPGLGGVGGGQGYQGQPSQAATGHAASSYGIPVIHTTTGLDADFYIQLTKDIEGTQPAELCSTPTINFVCKSSGGCCRGSLFTVPCEYLGNGRIKLTLTAKDTIGRQGLHHAEFQCYDQQGNLKDVFKCCIQIQKSLVDDICCDNFHPLTIAQVRMEVYDTSGMQNQLLNDLQYSDIVIARCMERAVQDWNEMPPELSRDFTVSDFPFKSNLCTGASGYLFRMAATRYIRNQMRHSNAGLSIDDNDKGQLYANLAQNALQEWRTWVQTKKTQINMLQCMGSISDIFMQGAQHWWH